MCIRDSTETVAITASAFELPADQIGEDMGKIANLYKIPIANISALGDAINYLDDNAQSQGGDIIDVMKRVAGVAGTVNMSFRDAAALGSSFLSLGAGREVAGTASSAMIRELAIAKMQPARFQQGLDAIGMSAEAIQAAMPTDATGTILKVLEAVNKLPDAKQLQVMTQLFGKEYGDDAAKLAKNVGEYRRQLELANSAAAEGSMVREAEARNAALSAQWQITLNHLFNENSRLGALLKDTVVDLLHTFNDWLDAIGEFTKEHPALVATLLKGLAAFAGIVAIGGAVTLTLGSLLGPIAMVRYGMEMFGIKSGVADSKLGKLAKNGIKLLGNSLLWLGRTFAAVGRLFLLNPIGIAITLIAGAAYLIYKNWGDISQFFKDRWADVKAAFDGGLGAVMTLLLNWNPIGLLYKAIVAGLEKLSIDVPAKFSSLGNAIIDGLIGGISAKFGALKEKITGIAGSVSGWFKDTLGIKSPSRVFMAHGRDTLAGYQQGLAANESGPLRQIGDFGKRMRQAGAGLAIGAASLPAVADIPLDTRPPISAASGGGLVMGDINITVNPAPGMDEQALARYVAAEVQRALAQATREAGAKRRSALYDID